LRFSGERPVYVTAHLCNDRVTVCVADHGEGFDCSRCQPSLLPDPQQAHGRGLHLMHELMDAVEVVPQPLGCVVRMTRHLALAASA
jgi:anti-sigma regulatory factor (Ser/Thr protein kinase)